MKIRISTIFLAIVIFQQFSELYATEQGEGSSSDERRRPGRPRGSVTKRMPGQSLGRPRGSVTRRHPGQVLGRPHGTQLNQNQFRCEDPNDGPPHRIVYYEQTEIKVWLDGPSVRKTIYPSNYIPQGRYYTYHNFLIRTLERGDVTIVAYISEDEELIGVRPPATTGHRHNLEPTRSEWYINLATTYLKVDVTNSTPTGMSLMHMDVHVPEESSIELQTVAGITFRLFRGYPDFKITGVELVSSARLAA